MPPVIMEKLPSITRRDSTRKPPTMLTLRAAMRSMPETTLKRRGRRILRNTERNNRSCASATGEPEASARRDQPTASRIDQRTYSSSYIGTPKVEVLLALPKGKDWASGGQVIFQMMQG